MTTTQRVRLQPAFVLHRRPWRESSWLLEIFSRDHGRLALIARAARRGATRRSALEPGRELLLSWAQRGELGSLQQAEAEGAGRAPAGEALLSVLYLNELLLRMTARHDPHPALFESYRGTLRTLQNTEPEAPLRYFELDLLEAAGYGLNLIMDREGKPIREDLVYTYEAGLGAGVVNAPAAAGHTVEGRVLIALRERRLDDVAARRTARRLLRGAIDAHLDRPLRTRGFAHQLRGLRAATPTSS